MDCIKNSTNEELALQAKQGNTEALERLYIQNSRLIYKICRPFANEKHPIQDLTQEAFFILLKEVEAYSTDCEYRFTTYLSKGLKWHLIRFMEQDKSKHEYLNLDAPVVVDSDITKLDLLVDDSINIETEVIQSVEGSEVVDSLPKVQRDFIHNRFWDSLTVRQIAEKQNVPIEAVRSTEQTTFRTLRQNKRLINIVRDAEIHSLGLRRGTAWTSSTEYAAIKLIENKN